MASNPLKVVFVGDNNVGKSTIIRKIVTGGNEDEELELPSRFEPVLMEAEVNGVSQPIEIIDTDDSDLSALEQTINAADSLILCYAGDDEDSRLRFSQHWIPYLQGILSQERTRSIVIVSNKVESDELADIVSVFHDDLRAYILESDAFSRCELEFVPCSAFNNVNLEPILSYAIGLLRSPVRTIWDFFNDEFTAPMDAALRRIFFIADTDKDGWLTYEDLSKLHGLGLDGEQGRQVFDELLVALDQAMPGNTRPVPAASADSPPSSAVNLEAFRRLLETVLIENGGQSDALWQLLSSFGYKNGSLYLPISIPAVDKHSNEQVVEVTDKGFRFLNDIYTAFTTDKKMASRLSVANLSNALSMIPPPASIVDLPVNAHPLLQLLPKMRPTVSDDEDNVNPDSEEGNNKKHRAAAIGAARKRIVSMQAACRGVPHAPELLAHVVADATGLPPRSWRALMSMVCSLDYATFIRYCHYWGYAGDLSELVSVSRTRSEERAEGQISRRTFNCYVFGSPMSGKATLINCLVGKRNTRTSRTSGQIHYAVNTVMDGDQEYTLMLQEFPEHMVREVVTSEEWMAHCDVACLAYDGSDSYSFSYVASLQKMLLDLESPVPCVYVLTKADLDIVQQKYEQTPEDFCRSLGLPWPPVLFSAEENDYGNLFYILVKSCLVPEACTPTFGGDEEDSRVSKNGSSGSRFWRRTFTLLLLAGVSYAGYFAYKNRGSSKKEEEGSA